MRILLATIAVLLVPVAACAGTKTYTVAPFDTISVSAGIVLETKVGGAQSIVAETADNNFDELVVEVRGKNLVLTRDPLSWGWLQPRRRYEVSVSVPALHALDASSGASANSSGPIDGDFRMQSSSGAHVRIQDLKAKSLSVHSSSGASAELIGTCEGVKASASSGAAVRAAELRCLNAEAQASSGGSVALFASMSASGNASSGGSVVVDGKPPQVQSSQSSGGRFTAR